MIESESLSMRIFLEKVTLTIGQEKYLLSILFWKFILGLINFQTYKDLNGEKNFY